MPRSWTPKDERQYEHVKESEKARGEPTDRAEEIAARTVNKHRREEGRTANERTSGTGNPRRPLSEHTVDELRNHAKKLKLTGISRMRKQALIEAIQKAS